MKSDRLLSTILLLQNHGQMSGRDLAERLEVSERTIHRDMDALSAAGVPVFALRGARGGWKLDDTWRTQVPALDEAELHALLMAQPRVVGNTRLAAAAERALNKLTASLPGRLREKVASIRQRLYVDTAGWRGVSEDLSLLPLIQDAVARDRKLAIRYAKTRGKRNDASQTCDLQVDGETVERVVDPLGLVAKGSAWYLVADGSSGFRTYRVSRIEQATVLEIAAKRPENFDLGAYWRSSTEQFRQSWPRFQATLRLHPRAAREMRLWRTASQVDAKAPTDENPGWTTLRVDFDDEEQAVFVILGMGSRVQVVAPTSLKSRVEQELGVIFSRMRFPEVNSGGA